MLSAHTPPESMSPQFLAALGVACLASVVWLARTAPPAPDAILDRTYR